MKILSIHDGHNASAAVFKDHKVLSCVSEERINRVKFYWGFPHESIKYVLKDSGIGLRDIDIITVSHLGFWDYTKRKLSNKSNWSLKPIRIYQHTENILVAFKRELAVRRLFLNKDRKQYFFCDHHLAHAASAYYYSGFDNALVVTIDGQGDGLSHTVYTVVNNKWNKITNGGSNASLGAFYAAVTEGLGFKPNRHEGKVVGLAAFTSPDKIKLKPEDDFIVINEDKLSFRRKGYYEMKNLVHKLKERGHTREEISSYAQARLEQVVVEHVNKLCEITGLKNLALAGGVFANVKLNQKLTEQCPIDKIFIQPAMGDEGLVLGSAYYYLDQIAKKKNSEVMHDVYFGTAYSDEKIASLLKRENIEFEIANDAAKRAAELINEDKIVGWFNGRMEFGPRALGSRSILANPQNRKINEILNNKLKRSEFMPFAPSVLYEKAGEVFEHIEPSIHPAEFMTITYNVKPEWHNRIKAVVHVDNTARPQLVKKEVNPAYHGVINEFYKLTGIPLVVNTSFNIHEEPIVSTPEDALRSFKTGAVDFVVFNNRYLVTK